MTVFQVSPATCGNEVTTTEGPVLRPECGWPCASPSEVACSVSVSLSLCWPGGKPVCSSAELVILTGTYAKAMGSPNAFQVTALPNLVLSFECGSRY